MVWKGSKECSMFFVKKKTTTTKAVSHEKCPWSFEGFDFLRLSSSETATVATKF